MFSNFITSEEETGEIGKIDAECPNCAQAKRRVCPKVYVCTSKGAVGTEKKEYLFPKSP